MCIEGYIFKKNAFMFCLCIYISVCAYNIAQLFCFFCFFFRYLNLCVYHVVFVYAFLCAYSSMCLCETVCLCIFLICVSFYVRLCLCVN